MDMILSTFTVTGHAVDGLSFAEFTVVLQLWISQLASLLKLLNWAVAFAGMTLLWASRDILPESIESKYIKILGIAVCTLLSIVAAFGCGATMAERMISGLITGCFIVGGGKQLFEFVGSIFASVLGLVVRMKTSNGNGYEPKITGSNSTEVK